MASSKTFEDYPGTESGDIHDAPPPGYGGRKPVSKNITYRDIAIRCPRITVSRYPGPFLQRTRMYIALGQMFDIPLSQHMK